MARQMEPHRRDLARLLGVALGTPLVIGAIVALPKDPVHAAPDRFVLTLIVFIVSLIGLVGFCRLRRRYREQGMLRRYGGVSSAIRDTLSHLKQERRLAARGQLLSITGAIVAFALYVLAYWPQMSMLGPYRSLFGFASIVMLALSPVCALRNRGHTINTFFLRRYLKQQLDHLGYRGGRTRRARTEREGASIVTVTGPGCFSVNGMKWSFDDFVKNALVLGQVGSGKTVCVLNTLLEGLIASSAVPENAIGGLILDAKGDFHEKIRALCRRYGREDDLYILDPSSWEEDAGTPRSIAWNPLQNEDDALEVATRLIIALRLIGLEQGNEGSFFLDSAKVFLRHAIALVRAAAITPVPSLVDVYRLSQENEEKTPLYHELVKAVAARHPETAPAEVTDAIAYFEHEWAPMADRQKSGVRGTVTQLLDEFLVSPFREIFTQPSTLSIGEMIDRGVILYINMPASDRARMSRLVNTLIKLEYQRNILIRPNKARPSFMLCDEFQTLYTSGEGRGDSDFFERSRESRHANIVAAQNLSAFYKRTKNLHDVKNFLGNAAVKIFLRQTEEETNRWASALFGQRSEIVITTSEQAALDGGWSKRRHTSYGRATRTLPSVPPEAFSRLAIPMRDDPAPQSAESIIHLASRGATERHEVAWPVNPLR
jgi:hypothetical protein